MSKFNLIFVFAEEVLLGLRHRNMTGNYNLNMVSFAGGLEFFIDGAGFDDEPHLNSVMFTNEQDTPQLFGGPALESKCSFCSPLATDPRRGARVMMLGSHPLLAYLRI